VNDHAVYVSVGGLNTRWRVLRAAILLAASLMLVSLLPSGVSAQGSDSSTSTAAPLKVHEYLMAGDDSRMRILLHFDGKPEYSWFLLRSPHRLVLDLPETEFEIDEDSVAGRGLVEDVRYGSMTEDQSRIIFSLKGPFSIEDMSVLENEEGKGYRLVLDLVSASQVEFDKAMLERMDAAAKAAAGSEAATDKAAESAKAADEDDRFTIAIDPGHGGIDGGARGASGIDEKMITLAFSLELKRILEEGDKYRVVMTRDRDVFLRLDERVRIAREGGADLLISIHAGAIRLKNFRGSTVYTLSERASDAEAAATAARENLSDELAGLEAEEARNDVADILADLMRRETHSFSIQFARTLVGELKDTVQLVNNPMRSAGFRVLRAHDVPSVLLELGYLSNAQDEKLLRDAKWRERAAKDISRAIDLFATARERARG